MVFLIFPAIILALFLLGKYWEGDEDAFREQARIRREHPEFGAHHKDVYWR